MTESMGSGFNGPQGQSGAVKEKSGAGFGVELALTGEARQSGIVTTAELSGDGIAGLEAEMKRKH